MTVETMSHPTLNLIDDVDVQLIDFMGNDDAIVQAARVSLKGANEVYSATGTSGLIQYLMREKHGSPFEHTAIKFYVKIPIFAAREFQRHRIASYNEMSGRYTQLPPDFYIVPEHRPTINIGTSAKPEMAPGSFEKWLELNEDLMAVYELAWEKYTKIMLDGHAKEVARIALPVGIFTQFYVSMNLRAAFNFLSLRTHRPDAVHVSRPQAEIEWAANRMEVEIKRLFPLAHGMFEKFGRVAP